MKAQMERCDQMGPKARILIKVTNVKEKWFLRWLSFSVNEPLCSMSIELKGVLKSAKWKIMNFHSELPNEGCL